MIKQSILNAIHNNVKEVTNRLHAMSHPEKHDTFTINWQIASVK
jgi:hypothetical protein